MSILAPVVSWMARITLPPGPMTSRMRSGLIQMTSTRGAYSRQLGARLEVAELAGRLALRHAVEDVEPALARLLQGALHDLPVDARILMSIWRR